MKHIGTPNCRQEQDHTQKAHMCMFTVGMWAAKMVKIFSYFQFRRNLKSLTKLESNKLIGEKRCTMQCVTIRYIRPVQGTVTV